MSCGSWSERRAWPLCIRASTLSCFELSLQTRWVCFTYSSGMIDAKRDKLYWNGNKVIKKKCRTASLCVLLLFVPFVHFSLLQRRSDSKKKLKQSKQWEVFTAATVCASHAACLIFVNHGELLHRSLSCSGSLWSCFSGQPHTSTSAASPSFFIHIHKHVFFIVIYLVFTSAVRGWWGIVKDIQVW